MPNLILRSHPFFTTNPMNNNTVGAPKNGTLIQEKTSNDIYTIYNGIKFKIPFVSVAELSQVVSESDSLLEKMPYGGFWKDSYKEALTKQKTAKFMTLGEKNNSTIEPLPTNSLRTLL